MGQIIGAQETSGALLRLRGDEHSSDHLLYTITSLYAIGPVPFTTHGKNFNPSTSQFSLCNVMLSDAFVSNSLLSGKLLL